MSDDLLADQTALGVHCAGDGRVSCVKDTVRLAVQGRERYSNAQLDDYHGLSRSDFLNRPPLTLTVRARFSHERAASPSGPGLLGTAGFGFWNDPFLMSEPRPPTLPRALWFFYAGPPSDMKLDLDVPGWGWKAAAIDALNSATLPVALAAPLLVPLMNVPAVYRRVWPGIQAMLRIRESLISESMIGWHTYTIEWGRDVARCLVDGRVVLRAPAPRGPLGLVLWCDNQYMIAKPWGRLGHGILQVANQWLELSAVDITRDRAEERIV